MSGRIQRKDEAGVFVVLYAGLIVALLAMAAIAVDISALRTDRLVERGAADAAVAAGAVQLSPTAPGPFNACVMAWNVAAVDLKSLPAALGQTPCSSPGSTITSTTACLPTDAARSVTGMVGAYKVTVTTPVPDADPLMSASAPGGGKSEPVSTSADGGQCSRVGLTIALARKSTFGGTLGIKSLTTTLHSVAKSTVTNIPGTYAPALVALSPTACETVFSKGTIEATANGTTPGIIEADSTGSTCSRDDILSTQGSGSIIADSGSGGTPGIIGYWGKSLPANSNPYTTKGITPTPTQMTHQVTRAPLDSLYRCTRVTPLPANCTTDYVALVTADYGTGGAGLAHLTTYAGSCSPVTPVVVPANGLYVNCPTFSPSTTIGAGLVVFSGDISLSSGAAMRVNTSTLDASGLPVPITPGADSLLVVHGSVSVASGGTLSLADTAMVMTGTANTLAIQSGSTSVRWTADTGTTSSFGTSPYAVANGLKNVLLWAESTGGVSFQGSPTFVADGIFAIPNGPLSVQNGSLDAQNVQVWCDSISANSGAAFVTLYPDPAKSIGTEGAVSALIR